MPKTPSLPKWKKELPMWLTWSRMLAAIPLTLIMLSPGIPYTGVVSTTLFILASLTDWLDGHYARKFDALSTMGKFMDPIADKILVSTVLILMVPGQIVHPVLVIIILGRDILIGGIRSIAAADQLIIDAKPTGKWKTAIQMIAIPACFLNLPILSIGSGTGGDPGWVMRFLSPFEPSIISTQTLGHALLWVSGILSVLSAIEYINLYRRGRKSL